MRRIKEEQATIEKAGADLRALSREKQDTIQRAEAALAALYKEKQKLLEAGFSPEALAEFNDRTRAIAARHHMAIAALRERLLHEMETLDKCLGLETLIQSKEIELKQLRQAITSAKKEQASLKRRIATLEQQQAALESSLKAAREKVIGEVARIIPALREGVTRLANELKLGNKGVLDEVNQLKEQAIEVGKEIGRYESAVKANEWLVELLSLVRGEDSLKAERVRAILLQVMQGSHFWMKRNQTKTGLSAPIYAVQRLVGELEQWQI